MAVELTLHDDLPRFLAKQLRGKAVPPIRLERRTSIKDFLEALGIPHPEIHRLLVNGREQDFACRVGPDDRIEVFGLPLPTDPTLPTPLRLALPAPRFAVDANVGKLAGLLRMTGFDTFFEPTMNDEALAEISRREQRILLTRDHALLKRKKVVHGRLVRHHKPIEQLREVIDLYGLRERIEPFSRCLRCNDRLRKVAKEEIINRLLPLTIKYYDDFRICPRCARLYWPGSHRERMLKIIKEL
ncbi:MAG: Mut7-C RNAse domain-containing protein [Desulfurivibrionaceae bacterium]